MKDFSNILVVRTDRMGDVILTTPAIKVLREGYPKAKITLLVQPDTKDLVEGNPCLDEVLVDDRRKANKGFGGFLRLVARLRSQKFDLAVIFHTKKRTNLFCFLAGIPHRIGYKNNKFGFLLTQPVLDTRHEGKMHEAQYCLELLKSLDLSSDHMDFFVALKKESEEWAGRYLNENNIRAHDRLIAIHPGASDPSRRWPDYYFSELVDKILEKHKSRIVLVGGPDIQATAHRITSLAHHPLLDITGKTTVSQLASVLKRCYLLISNDSGPVHLASGLGVPVVSIFTRNQPGINPERWKPLSKNSMVVSVPLNGTISFVKAGPVDPKYMELVKIQEVVEAVDAIFKLC